MSVIKNLLLKLEKLENNYKILQGKLDKLKISVDLVNTEPKELPDAFTYKPQQPYMGLGVGLKLQLIKEDTLTITGRTEYVYIEPNGEMRLFLLIREARIVGSSGVSLFYDTTWTGTTYVDGEYKIYIMGTEEDSTAYIHYKIYELVYDFGNLTILT